MPVPKLPSVGDTQWLRRIAVTPLMVTYQSGLPEEYTLIDGFAGSHGCCPATDQARLGQGTERQSLRSASNLSRAQSSMTAGYGVIYCDPPWTFKTRSEKGKGRSAEAHYDCMSLADLKLMGLSVREWAAPDCVLFLWTTDPMLVEAIDVIRAWGFIYKTTGFVWAKTHGIGGLDIRDANFPIGMGYWTRSNPEICLLATRGNPKRQSRSVRKLIVAPRREHSRKPDEIYERIEQLCVGPYLELFARGRRAGWDSVGHEVDSGIGERRWRSDMSIT